MPNESVIAARRKLIPGRIKQTRPSYNFSRWPIYKILFSLLLLQVIFLLYFTRHQSAEKKPHILLNGVWYTEDEAEHTFNNKQEITSFEYRTRQSAVSENLTTTTPRLVYYDKADFPRKRFESWIEFPAHPVLKEDKVHSSRDFDADENGCVPISWQTKVRPSCNKLHEISFSENLLAETIEILPPGTIRDGWKVSESNEDANGSTSYVLKTLLFSWNPSKFSEDLQARDAIATEHLTKSSSVMDSYGYCAQSSINQIADTTLAHHVRHFKTTSLERLFLAAGAAKALGDMHDIDGNDFGTLVMRDAHKGNFLMDVGASRRGPMIKVADFNIARFMPVKIDSGFPCPITTNECSAWRSPEECKDELYNEKVDVYQFGTVLYFLLTFREPYDWLDNDTVKEYVRNGSPLPLSDEKENAYTDPVYKKNILSNPALRSILYFMEQCFEYSVEKRPSARDIANGLITSLSDILHEIESHNNEVALTDKFGLDLIKGEVWAVILKFEWYHAKQSFVQEN